MNTIPLSLYIHVPWCIKKCPYCDFNSHAVKDSIPEMDYVNKLIQDLKADLSYVQNRKLHSIFIGGGTPSLFSAKAYEVLLEAIFKLVTPETNIEITLEANPGTVEQQRFKEYRAAGINRLSIGCQSFNETHLKNLGRIHDQNQAIRAADSAHNADFDNFNLDLMFALSRQTVSEALEDLETALSLQPTHLSWYQLTLEPNTVFHRYPPALPHEDIISEMILLGKILLKENGFDQYEISAYSKSDMQCRHNLNYWRFGDYLGIGAGAHGKLTDSENDLQNDLQRPEIIRTTKYKQPKSYLNNDSSLAEKKIIARKDLPFEFMLNALRLEEPVSFELFKQRTGLDMSDVMPILHNARAKELLIIHESSFQPSKLGRLFLNDLTEMFL